jgi:hypothetical protein
MSWTSNFRRLDRRQAAALVAVIAVVAISTGLVLQSQPSSPGATGRATPSIPAVAATGTPEPWGALTLPTIERAATLEPVAPDPAGIAPEAGFVLTSLTGEPAATMAARLEISPVVALAVETPAEPGTPGDTVRIRPATSLAPNQSYRFTLRSADGAVAGSWAYRVRGPVAISSTIPGNAVGDVPVATGIEITFNQAGVESMADHFSITPAVEGRFEQHGLTQVFVPSALTPATLYTVTIAKGLARSGTDLTLPTDVVFRFETRGATNPPQPILPAREVVETSPTEAPVMAVFVPRFDNRTPPTEIGVEVYRLPSVDAAATVLADFLSQPHWTQYTRPHMATRGLPVAATFTAALEPFRDDDVFVVRFPAALEPGWYIVDLGDESGAQAFLQVTRVSAWASVLSDRSVIWVNDVMTGTAIADAAVTVQGGGTLARSDGSGLAIGPTPAALVPPAAQGDSDTAFDQTPVLRVTAPSGATVLVPFGVAGDLGYRGEWYEKSTPANETYWSLLYTDRGFYRSDDRIEAWGYLRGRDDGRVPGSVVLRLVRGEAGRDAAAPAIVESTARPGASGEPVTNVATGAYGASLELAGIPTGWYVLQAVVDGEVVATRWIQVAVIRKPAYELTLLPDRRAVVVGTAVEWTATATFFDGTPAASVPLVFRDQASGSEAERTATTDAAGVASVTFTAKAPSYGGGTRWEDPTSWYVYVQPTGPEAGEVYGQETVLVFPTAYSLRASGTLTNDSLRITGTLNQVDLAAVNRSLAAGGWEDGVSDAAIGAAVPGRTITAAVTELIPVRTKVGDVYDFIEKVVRPRYEYSTRRTPVATQTATTAADGTFSVSLTVPDPSHLYEVVLTTTDDSSRVQSRSLVVGQEVELSGWEDWGPVFEQADGTLAGSTDFRIGSRISWTITDAGQAAPSGGDDRYLYITAQRGLRGTEITTSPTFGHTFGAADAPGIFIVGIRFTGTTYAPKAASWAWFDREERAIEVTVTSDRARYRPGESVTLTVTTADVDGDPVPSTVEIQAVDEKLYAIGGASTPEALRDLYAAVDSGILRITSTHQVPTRVGPEGEGGDTTGGGPRSDFRDTLFVSTVSTDATGKGTVTVRLSDDLTSWHVTATAVTDALQAGVGELLVPVGLPFFVEATVANSYLVSDRPAIQLRAFGSDLTAGDPVEFTVASATLGIAATKVSGSAFQPVWFTLPALSPGPQTLDIAATTTRLDAAGKPLGDRLLARFEVIESRLTEVRATYGTIGVLPEPPGSAGITTYTFSDAGRGHYLPLLRELVQPAGPRLDRTLARWLARSTLIDEFGYDPSDVPEVELDLGAYPQGTWDDGNGNTMTGIGLLPYGGVDPWVAVRVAIDAPDAWVGADLRSILLDILNAPSTERDLAIAAVAALAAVGEPVTADLEAIGAQADLTTRERTYLALGYAALGDDATALELERSLLAESGERLGDWVRLRSGVNLDEILEATSLLSLVAASVGDPLAPAMADYVAANPSREATYALDLAANARRMIARSPAVDASFAYSIGGQRRVVELTDGRMFSLELTAAQVSGLSLERLSGAVGVTIDARVAVDVGDLHPNPALAIRRTVPAGPIVAGRLVVVDLVATLGPAAPKNGCYEVVEQVPSGLAPVEMLSFQDASGVTLPSRVSGQEVVFCATKDVDGQDSAHLRYVARVLGQGTFTWEPAVMQLSGAPELLAFVPTTSVEVVAAP